MSLARWIAVWAANDTYDDVPVGFYDPSDHRQPPAPASFVEELVHFPFPNYASLKAACILGHAGIVVDRAVAVQWVGVRTRLVPDRLSYICEPLMVLSLLLPTISVLAYAFFRNDWWLCASLPLLVIGFFILAPAMRVPLGSFQTVLVVAIGCALLWALGAGEERVILMTCGLLWTWLSLRVLYALAQEGIVIAALNFEPLLCKLWQAGALCVDFPNGDRFRQDYQVRDGQMYHYTAQSRTINGVLFE